MSNRSIGFGSGEDTSGVVVSPDIIKESQEPERASAEYLREIRDRYVQNAGLQTRIFNLAANAAVKFDESQTVYNAFMLTVTAGVALIYFGDYTGLTGTTGNTPHYVLSSGVVPASQIVPLPPGNYVFTVQADASGVCSGCLLPMAL